MVTLRLGPEDVANLRFAISPLMELHNSVRALGHPEAKSLHLPWVAATRERVRDLDMALLHALHPRKANTPDFISPPPRSPLGDLEAELAEMLATPADQIRAEVLRVYAPAPLPPVLQPFADDPPAARRPPRSRTLAQPSHWSCRSSIIATGSGHRRAGRRDLDSPE